MLHLPASTDISRALPKKVFFSKCNPRAAERRRFDTEIRQISFVNEISPATVNCAPGGQVSAVFILRFLLRGENCDRRNLLMFSRETRQHVLFVLEHADQARLAVVHAGQFYQTEQKPLDAWHIVLAGLNMDTIWENLVAQVGGVRIGTGLSLNDTLASARERKNLEDKIAALEKKVGLEKQFNRRVELNAELRKLQARMEIVSNSPALYQDLSSE